MAQASFSTPLVVGFFSLFLMTPFSPSFPTYKVPSTSFETRTRSCSTKICLFNRENAQGPPLRTRDCPPANYARVQKLSKAQKSNWKLSLGERVWENFLTWWWFSLGRRERKRMQDWKRKRGLGPCNLLPLLSLFGPLLSLLLSLPASPSLRKPKASVAREPPKGERERVRGLSTSFGVF